MPAIIDPVFALSAAKINALFFKNKSTISFNSIEEIELSKPFAIP